MVRKKETFGERIREKRTEKQITLRKFAEMIGVSPTYVSQIERNEFNPPSEEKIRLIAKILDEDTDEMLALANKVSSDLPRIIQQHPKQAATFLRTVEGFSQKDWEELMEQVSMKAKREDGRK